MTDIVEAAERHSRTRSVLMAVNGVYFACLSIWMGMEPAFHGSRLIVWPILLAVSVAELLTGGYLLKPRKIRLLMNDELSIQNRADAIRVALLATMILAGVIYCFAIVRPIDVITALRLSAGLGVSAGLLRYAWLERS